MPESGTGCFWITSGSSETIGMASTTNYRHSDTIRSTENNTQCFSRKNANTNDEPETIVHVISHLQVSQIPKIKSKKGTGTWNPCRMTTFQVRSVGETSLNQEKLQKWSKSTKCYIHFHNFPESSAKHLMLFHIYKCRRFRKSNQKRASELGIPAEWQHSR